MQELTSPRKMTSKCQNCGIPLDCVVVTWNLIGVPHKRWDMRTLCWAGDMQGFELGACSRVGDLLEACWFENLGGQSASSPPLKDAEWGATSIGTGHVVHMYYFQLF